MDVDNDGDIDLVFRITELLGFPQQKVSFYILENFTIEWIHLRAAI